MSYGLSAWGQAFGGSWYNPATYFGNVPVINNAASSSVSSMVMAGINGDDIGDAGLSGLLWGGVSSILNSAASLGLVYATNAIGGTSALNNLYGEDKELGFWMTEIEAAEKMEKNPGYVSASVANDGLGVLIAILSGGGPFSHVRGSDIENVVLENNSKGVMDYWDETYMDRSLSRLTFVVNKYKAGVTHYTPKVRDLVGKGYLAAGLCTGATHSINPAYMGGAPNALYSLFNNHFYQGAIW